jgi:tRNA pseudouridine38-40 synthase
VRNILLTVSYDGTRFCGWQKQGSISNNAKKHIKPSVQGEIEHALSIIHDAQTPLNGSGRTDAGVHAAGQAANFFSPIDSIPVEKYPLIVNNLLPRDIRVHAACQKDDNFHARFSAVNRTYRYFIHSASIPLAASMPFVWCLRKTPDASRLNAMASHLWGELDFSTFTASTDASQPKNRFVEKAVFYPCGDVLVFEICANAFLWKMVRSILGTLIQFEREGRDAAFFKDALDSRDRRRAGMTAPSKGLFLWNVAFEGKRRH